MEGLFPVSKPHCPILTTIVLERTTHTNLGVRTLKNRLCSCNVVTLHDVCKSILRNKNSWFWLESQYLYVYTFSDVTNYGFYSCVVKSVNMLLAQCDLTVKLWTKVSRFSCVKRCRRLIQWVKSLVHAVTFFWRIRVENYHKSSVLVTTLTHSIKNNQHAVSHVVTLIIPVRNWTWCWTFFKPTG